MRALLLTLVLIGLALPRLGAALAEIAGFETVVICRGDTMVALTIDDGGDPVETEIEPQGPCLGVALPARTVRPDVARRILPLPVGPGLQARASPGRTPGDGPPPQRGPPTAA